MMALPSTAQAFWLLTRLRMTRLMNLSGTMFRRWGKKKAASKSRAAGFGKTSVRWVLTLLVGAIMMAGVLMMTQSSVLNLECQLHTAGSCAALASDASQSSAYDAAASDLAAAPPVPVVFRALMLMLGALFAIAVLLPLSSKELAQGDWDMEWLITLPVKRSTLLWARVVERSFANPTPVFALLPMCAVLAWDSGLRWSAPLAALVATVPLLLLASMLRTVCDTGLRLWLPPSQLRNLQAMASLVVMPMMYLVMSFGMPQAKMTTGWAAQAPAWPGWTPIGSVVSLLTARDAGNALSSFALLLVQSTFLLLAGMWLLQRQLARGVVAGGSRESARKTGARSASAGAGRSLGTPLQRRELRLLSRDRNFLMQSLLLPIIVVGSQLVFNGALDDVSQLGSNPQLLATTAFGLGAYVLLLSAFQTINTEGHSLWMLYTFPRTMHSMLREKAQLWAVLASAYPLAVFGIGLATSAQPDLMLVSRLVLVMAGIPMFATLAVSLGVWASDPLSPDPHNRVKPTFVYLYMMLTASYSYAIYSDSWHVKLTMLVLLGSLAAALWQRAHDALPYLLDPAAAPPPRVSLSDGLIAAVLFSAAQSITYAVLAWDKKTLDMEALLIAFAGAGAVTYVLTRFVFWRTKATGVPPIRPARPLAALGWGIGMALPAIALAFAYMAALRHFDITVPGRDLLRSGLVMLVPLTVLAAPLFEEFIFRGLIFQGMRRSIGLLPAMAASAAIFAVVHPPLSMLPVFGLGLCAAYAAERSKSLMAPMLAHAVYNGAIVYLSL